MPRPLPRRHVIKLILQHVLSLSHSQRHCTQAPGASKGLSRSIVGIHHSNDDGKLGIAAVDAVHHPHIAGRAQNIAPADDPRQFAAADMGSRLMPCSSSTTAISASPARSSRAMTGLVMIAAAVVSLRCRLSRDSGLSGSPSANRSTL